MIETLSESAGNVVGFTLSGKLHDEDYKEFQPAVEKVIEEQGKIRLLAHFHDFHGWDAKAVWDDTKFATKHCADVERVALVGENTWEKWMAKVCAPFTLAKIRYFDAGELDEAWSWLREA